MNEKGLAASVTLGGGRSQGRGFSIILVIRYVLRPVSRSSSAVKALCRIPVALAQNVTVLDSAGNLCPSVLGPGQRPIITRLKACAKIISGRHDVIILGGSTAIYSASTRGFFHVAGEA